MPHIRVSVPKMCFALLLGAAVSMVSAPVSADPSLPLGARDGTISANQGMRVSIADASADGQAVARVWWPVESVFERVIVVSPGALISASAMSAFARVLAEEHGALVFVVDYAWSVFRESPEEQKTAYVYVEEILAGGMQVQGLPSELRERLSATGVKGGAWVELFGHSAGGAILAPRIDTPPVGLSRVVLFGVSSLFRAPSKPIVPTLLIAGAQDGLVSPAGLGALGVLFNTSPVQLPNVNHFCIVSDLTAGDPDKRKLDGPSSLDAMDCSRRVADAWLGAKR